MKLETFFEKFDLFAEAPGAVERMRELVLDLAATGRLLADKNKWEKRLLKSVTTKIGSGATPAGGRESYFSEGTPLIRSMNVHFRGFEKNGLVFLSDEQANGLSNVIVQANDVLLNITGASIGRVTIAPIDMTGARVNQHVTIIRPTPELLPIFLSIFLASPTVQRMIDDIQIGATRQALTKGMIEQFEIPLPPLAEQHRIVAKVDELMTIIDQLEVQIEKAKKTGAALLDAAIHELLNPREEAAVDRTGIGCHVVHMLADRKTFGRTALAKFAYLAETHVGLPFNGQYLREAAGPLDPWIYRFEEEATRERWFTFENTPIHDGNRKIIYRKGEALEAKASEAVAALPKAQRDELDRVLTLLGGKPTEEVEIIATLFAVWNDFLIDGHSPSDEDIVTGFREQWHKKKQKFTAKSLHTWLDWMRRNDLVPTGHGPRTQQHPKLDLH